ncbi:MAG: aminotransferase class I/II-fold pyridoxal phosphate-dependent enzyme [Polyangiales bacterium]
MKIETLSVHVGRAVDAATGAVVPPLHLSTTFERAVDGSYPNGYVYTRPANPTRLELEACLAALEGGADALAFSSGSAASATVFALLRPGDRVVAPRESYHGTAKQLRDMIAPLGVEVVFADLTSDAAVRDALSRPTRLVWVETPSNPMLNVSDIAAIVALARAQGALVCVDSTFGTPLLQRPLALGADLVMHSTTKYLAGHSDVLGGALITREAGALAAQLRDLQATAGAVPSPFDCFLLRRSLTTFPWRMRAQTDNALRIATFLSTHHEVARTYYPGLAGHPGHTVAARQMQGGFGAMVSFCVHGGREEALGVAGRLKLFTRATSLGGVESLVEHRASIEGPHTVTPETLLRLSIGLEHADDLIADLAQGLEG